MHVQWVCKHMSTEPQNTQANHNSSVRKEFLMCIWGLNGTEFSYRCEGIKCPCPESRNNYRVSWNQTFKLSFWVKEEFRFCSLNNFHIPVAPSVNFTNHASTIEHTRCGRDRLISKAIAPCPTTNWIATRHAWGIQNTHECLYPLIVFESSWPSNWGSHPLNTTLANTVLSKSFAMSEEIPHPWPEDMQMWLAVTDS